MINSRILNKSLFRKSFSKNSDLENIPNLIFLQKDSYTNFLQHDVEAHLRENIGIESVFRSFFPLQDVAGKATIEYLSYSLENPKYEVEECISSGRSYASPLKAKLRLILWDNDLDSERKSIKSIKEQEVYLCDIPMMTDGGSFIINGAERVIVSQMRRAPGVFFDSEIIKATNSKSYSAKIVPNVGSWIDFEFDSKDILHFRVDKKRKIPATSLLRAFNLASSEIINIFYEPQKALFKNGLWVLKFNYDELSGKKAVHDYIDPATNEILIKDSEKINSKLISKIKKQNIEYYLLTDDVLIGYIIAEDLTDKDTGEILLESGSIITPETLELITKFGFDSINIVNPSKSYGGSYIYNTLLVDRNQNQKDALYDIYKAVRAGDSPASLETALQFFENLFFNESKYDLSSVGRMKMNHRLSLNIDKNKLCLTQDDIIKTIRILTEIKNNDLKTDDIDNLSNRRVRPVGELIENQLRIGVSRIEKSIIEKLNSVEIDMLMPQALINAKPLISSIKDFFATSQLSQFMDQTNPLSDITHKRRISALGPGGLTRDRAGFEVRDVHPTHYGRICPIETPEGQNIGLINSLATYSRVNSYGFIETPFRRVRNGYITDEIVYLSALDEVDCVTAPYMTNLDKDGKILSEIVNCRKNGEFIISTPDKIDYTDVSPKQIVSVATTLIPFLENDDANRALMGSNMQRQAVPLLYPQPPFVGTGMESIVATDSGAVVRCKRAGKVSFVDSSKIIIEVQNDSGEVDVDTYSLLKFTRTNQDTCINQKPTVKEGEYVQKGQIITDGHSIANGELALGKNVRVAFMPWNGYNFEDSIIISERLISNETFTSVHIEEFEVIARDTRLGPEEITRDIPNLSEESLSKLDEEGIIHIGSRVKPGDILVGKTTPKSDSPMTPEEKLLKVIFGEKASDVKDSSLYASVGTYGVVVDVKVFSRKGIDKDERSISIETQKIEKLTRLKNQKLSFLEKAIKNKILELIKAENIIGKTKKVEQENLEKLSLSQLAKLSNLDRKTEVEIEKLINNYNNKKEGLEKDYNERIVRYKSGDDLSQGVLKVVKVYIAQKYRLQPGDKMAGRHGNKGVVSKIAPVEDMPYSEDGEPVDIILNPLGVPSRMNVGQILETHLGYLSRELGKGISELLNQVSTNHDENIKKLRNKILSIYNSESENVAVKKMSDNELMEFADKLKSGIYFATGVFEGSKDKYLDNLYEISGIDKTGQVDLYDGRTGVKFDRKVTVGYIYMLKLHHLVDDKIHARSIGPYSLITQQPLGGKSHFGGQRFGEMECWALQAYGAAYTLQEMLTVKSDDVVGRIKIYESIIQGNQNFNCGIPESFNVMVKEVRSLGLNIELIEK